MGQRSQLAEELSLDRICLSNIRVSSTLTPKNGRKPSASEFILTPNLYTIGDFRLEEGTTQYCRVESEEENCGMALTLLRRMYGASADESVGGGKDSVYVKIIFIFTL